MPEAYERDGRLEGWKEIAGYLNREVRTVQRWEKHESLPVRRHQHQHRAAPYAYREELDEWRKTREPSAAAQPQRHRVRAGVVITLVAVGAAAAFLYLRRASPLTDRDSILLADFHNSTGDEVFDGALALALAVGLEQSPFLNVVSRNRVSETLRLMGRPSDERLGEGVAREVCQRQRLKALIAGSIDVLGSHYVIGLNAMHCETGESLAREQAEAAGREQVLQTLGAAVSRLRAKLGESLASIRNFDAPLEQVTTPSLDALKAFSAGEEQRARGSESTAVPFFKRAMELDPNFALAYDRLGANYNNVGEVDLAIQHFRRAYELRTRASERESFNIEARYQSYIEGDWDRYFETLELWARAYPRDWYAAYLLAEASWRVGQFEKAFERAQHLVDLNPDSQFTYDELEQEYEALNRFADAKAVAERAIAYGINTIGMHRDLFQMAFVLGDASAMDRHIAWAAGKPDEEVMLQSRADAAAFGGQLRRSRELAEEAGRIILSHQLKEAVSRVRLHAALIEAACGNTARAIEEARAALGAVRTPSTLRPASLVFALAGDGRAALETLDDLANRGYPWLSKVFRASVVGPVQALGSLALNDPTTALDQLKAAGTHELLGGNFVPVYVRGLTLLAAHDAAAVAEFQKILDHRGVHPLSVFYPLSQLQLARAYAQAGDKARSRQQYDTFFATWKDADADVPVLIEARREYSTLK
jgi:tetratricopeptide (TPR) repeat protein